MSNQTKKGGLFRAASILLLINQIFNIVALVILGLYSIILIPVFAILMSRTETGSAVASIVLIVIAAVAIVISLIALLVYIIVYGKARKKLLNANSKDDYKGWMIACIVLTALLGPSILGLVGPILALCVPRSDFDSPVEAEYTDNSFSADNTMSDF